MNRFYRWVIAVSATALCGPVMAQNAPIFKSLPCAEQVYHVFEQWTEIPQHWVPVASLADGVVAAKASTDKIGTWYYLQTSAEKGTSLVLRRTPHTQIRVRFTQPKCVPEIALDERPRSPVRNNSFSDRDLESILQNSAREKSSGVIYMWSPHMALSLQGFNEVAAICARLHLQFIPVLDPNSALAVAKTAAATHHLANSGLRKLASTEISERDGTLHFPSIFVFASGQFMGEVIPGYKSPDVYKELIEERLKK